MTGASRRIGRALALAAAGAGYDVAVHYHHSGDEAADAAGAIEAAGRRAAVVRGDLAHLDEVQALIPAAQAALGDITLLINCASLFDDDRVGTISGGSFDSHMAVNVRAPVFLAQAFAAQAPAGSSVINIIDQRVLHPNPQFFSYTLSKAALWTATRTLAQALAPRIRVNAIGPGPVLPSIHQAPGEFDAEAGRVPLERRVAPEEICAALLYLVNAASVTGQMIAVDGGQHLAWRTPDIVND